MEIEKIEGLDFSKIEGLVPVVIQHVESKEVLMLGFINQEALEKTLSEDKVTFYSRSKQRLWTKGESSGNFLYWKDIKVDCDRDSILIQVIPVGPTCHTGANSCFFRDISRKSGKLAQ